VTRDVARSNPLGNAYKNMVAADVVQPDDLSELEARLLEAGNHNVRPTAHETVGIIEDLIADEGLRPRPRHPTGGPGDA
jgi:hypothetical protein